MIAVGTSLGRSCPSCGLPLWARADGSATCSNQCGPDAPARVERIDFADAAPACVRCVWLEAAERAAIEDRPAPDEVTEPCSCPEHAIDVLHVAPAAFRCKPQIGEPLRLTWDELAVRLMRPTIGTDKASAGAWSPARYRGNVRQKNAIECVHALVIDVDEAGDVERVAAVLASGGYRAIVHETFTSTSDAPRCRPVLALSRPIDAPTYEAVHRIVRAHLAAAGVVADEAAKDSSRVSYWPVRRAGASYGFRVLDGRPLDVDAVLAAQPPEPERPKRDRVERDDADPADPAYRAGALVSAALEVATASAGDRHGTLCREAYSLARPELGFTETEVLCALLPAFVTAAGEARTGEGKRAIRDCYRAGRRAA